MKMTPGSRRHSYAARIGVFLVMAALIAGLGGAYYVGGGNTPLAQNLEIRTWYDLDAVRDNLAGNHTLMNDLDSTTAGYEELASPTANQGEGWQPIGFFIDTGSGCGPPIADGVLSWVGLTGTFDGQGYEIHDLFINRPNGGPYVSPYSSHIGLFGTINYGGIIKNVGVVNVTVIGGVTVGSLVGYNYGTVSDSYSSGNVTGNGSGVGGLVGITRGPVSDSYSTGNVTGHSEVGGLVGIHNDATVSNSYSTSNVIGTDWSVGGLVGENRVGDVFNSYSTGNVTGEFWVGGLVGYNWDSTVSNSYSTGKVTGDRKVGGLVGKNNDETTVSNSYSTGKVTGNSSVGGLVGDNDEGTVSNSFWDVQTSGQATSDGGTGKTTAQMKNIATFSGAAWNIIAVGGPGEHNITYTWNIVVSTTYPFLSWQP